MWALDFIANASRWLLVIACLCLIVFQVLRAGSIYRLYMIINGTLVAVPAFVFATSSAGAGSGWAIMINLGTVGIIAGLAFADRNYDWREPLEADPYRKAIGKRRAHYAARSSPHLNPDHKTFH